LAPKARVITG
jgi:hypothetical protein